MAEATTLKEAGRIGEGHFIVIDGRPCKVWEVQNASTNRKPSRRRFVGHDLFDRNNMHESDAFAPDENCVVPRVNIVDLRVAGLRGPNIPGPRTVVLVNPGGRALFFQVTDQTHLDRITTRLEEGKEVVGTVLSTMAEDKLCAFKAINPIY